MKLLAAVLFALGLSVSSAGAAELSYNWKAGVIHRFSAESQDTTTLSGMGVNQAFSTSLRSTFALKIDKVKPNGTALATLFVEAFEVKDDEGNKLAGLEGIPKGAVKNLVEIDRKGNFTFVEEVFLVVDEQSGQSMLVSHKVNANKDNVGGSASAQSGDEKVTLYASFDSKTGKLNAGYTVKKLAKPSKKTVTITQDKPKVDLLPTQFLELLKLPEGQLAAGTNTPLKFSHPNIDSSTTMHVRIDELTEVRARFNTKVASDNKTTTPTSAPNDSEHETAHPGTDMEGMGMPGMGGMGMPGMGTPKMGGSNSPDVSMTLKISADFDTDFDLAKGQLNGLSGLLKTSSKVGGMMAINTQSKLVLRRL